MKIKDFDYNLIDKNKKEIKYFDHAATTQIKKEVIEEMLPYLDEEYGNPSSIHLKGIKAKEAIEISRKKIAENINASPYEIYFTSGGTEADNMAIKGFTRANKKRGNHIITTKIEHKAVLETCRALEEEGFEITYLNVDKYGLINLQELEDSIKSTTILISVMFANNEIGTIQPIKQIGEIAKEHKIAFHTDAVQAIGLEIIDVEELNIDMLSMSAHKFYGPKGVGVLYVKKDIEFQSIICGGGQEQNKRAGTENVANIVGMAKAIELATENRENYNRKLENLSRKFLKEIKEKIKNVKLNGHPIKRLKGNINLSIPNIDAESLLLLLSERGICISTASACSSNSKKISHVLKAIGLKEAEAKGTVRITFGEENTENDIEFLIENLADIIENLQQM